MCATDGWWFHGLIRWLDNSHKSDYGINLPASVNSHCLFRLSFPSSEFKCQLHHRRKFSVVNSPLMCYGKSCCSGLHIPFVLLPSIWRWNLLLRLFAFLFPVKDESILNLYNTIAYFFVKSICPLIPTGGIQMKLGSTWEILFYAFHQTNAAAFSAIDAVNKYSADVYPVFCFIRE